EDRVTARRRCRAGRIGWAVARKPPRCGVVHLLGVQVDELPLRESGTRRPQHDVHDPPRTMQTRRPRYSPTRIRRCCPELLCGDEAVGRAVSRPTSAEVSARLIATTMQLWPLDADSSVLITGLPHRRQTHYPAR